MHVWLLRVFKRHQSKGEHHHDRPTKGGSYHCLQQLHRSELLIPVFTVFKLCTATYTTGHYPRLCPIRTLSRALQDLHAGVRTSIEQESIWMQGKTALARRYCKRYWGGSRARGTVTFDLTHTPCGPRGFNHIKRPSQQRRIEEDRQMCV